MSLGLESMDLREETKSKRRLDEKEESEYETERRKRISRAIESLEEEDERQRRIILQAPHDPFNRLFYAWRNVPDVLPRYYEHPSQRNAIKLIELESKIRELIGVQFSMGSDESEVEHARWAKAEDAEKEKTLGACNITDAFDVAGINAVKWRTYKQDMPNMVEFYSKFNCPVLISTEISRKMQVDEIKRILKPPIKNVSPANTADILRDSPACTLLRVCVLVDDVEPIPELSDEEKKETNQFVDNLLANPPNPWYIIEEFPEDHEHYGEFAYSEHLQLLGHDLVINTPRALKMVKTLKGFIANLPVDEWARSFNGRRKMVAPRCVIPPSTGLKFKSPWQAKDILQNWPVEYSIYLNHTNQIGETYLMQELETIASACMRRIQSSWTDFTKPSSYVKTLKPIRKEEYKHEYGIFERTRDATQEDADNFARYMHFPANPRHFHIVFEFGFSDVLNPEDGQPNHINCFTDKFLPDVLVAPTAQIAFYHKLDKQGQLLRIRCFPPRFHRYDVEGIRYRVEEDPSIVSFDYGDETTMNAICTRIGRAQIEEVNANLVLNSISKLNPRLGLDQVNPLVRSFLGGKYCHNPGCDKESTVQCGHCDDAAYCSEDCAGKHWPSHH